MIINDRNIKQFLEEFADIIETDAASINENTLVHNGDGWDSINLMATIALIDKHFGITLPLSFLREATNVNEVLKIINDTIKLKPGNQPQLSLVSGAKNE